MTDPLEQRLRDALEAYARSVTPEDLDRSREQEVAEITRAQPARFHSRWGWRIGAVGLAAAALVVGSLTISNLTDSSPHTTQADPLPSAPATDESGAGSGAEPRTATTAAPTAHSESAKPDPTPAPPHVPAPSQRRSEPSASAPEDPQPSTSSATSRKAEPEPSAPTNEPAPRTFAMTSPSGATGRLQVRVDATPSDGNQSRWQATASGTASSTSPTGGVLRYTVDHGDGTVEARTVRERCDDAPVRAVTFSTGEGQHQYRTPGTFRVSVRVEYCAAGDQVAVGTATRTVAIP